MSSSSVPPSRRSEERPELPTMSIFAALGWAFAATFAFLLLQSLAIRAGSPADLVPHIACQAVAYLLALFGILQLYAPDASIRRFLGARLTHRLFYPLAILLGVSLEPPMDALYDRISARWPTHDVDAFTKMFHQPDTTTSQRVVFGLLIVLIGPAIEEMFFRGALYRPLRKTYPVNAVIPTTAVLFAVAHFEWQLFLPIGLVGLVLATLRWASGSILPSLLLHAAFNGASFARMAVTRPGIPDPIVPRPVLAAITALAVALSLFVYFIGSRTSLGQPARELDRS